MMARLDPGPDLIGHLLSGIEWRDDMIQQIRKIASGADPECATREIRIICAQWKKMARAQRKPRT